MKSFGGRQNTRKNGSYAYRGQCKPWGIRHPAAYDLFCKVFYGHGMLVTRPARGGMLPIFHMCSREKNTT